MSRDADILFLDHAGVLGGAELSLHDIAVHFRDRGRVVLLADGPFREMLEESGVAVEVVPAPASMNGIRREAGFWSAVGPSVGLARLIARLLPHARRARLIYANSQKAFVLAACLGLLARRPVVWHLRDILTTDHFSPLNLRVTTRLARWSGARVIANSEATREALIDAGGSPERAVTIHNGISPAALDAVGDEDAASLRRELGIPADAILVGAFSRFAPWKGQHVLVEATPHLPDAHALLVGDALFGESGYRDRLVRTIDQKGVAERVHLLGFRRDVPRLMKACDVIAHTSIAAEPFGRVIVEGMLARRPVVATRAGGAREIIARRDEGLLVPPGDVDALVAALRLLQDNPSLRRALAENGRRRAERDFSVEAMLAGVEREIEPLLRRRSQALTDDSPIDEEAGSTPEEVETDSSDATAPASVQHGRAASVHR